MRVENRNLLDTTEIYKAISLLKPNNQLFEVRLIGDRPMSGYFRDAETLIKAFDTVDFRNYNAYITLNYVKDALYSRQQADKFLKSKTTTQDSEIEGYEWLFIDFDPERPSGISSTDEELKIAGELAQKVYVYLKGIGFEEPIKACSGNGFHLLYSIRLGNTDENKKLIERCLKALSMMFSNDQVKIDTVNHNPSRICKLYGTKAQKGSDSKDRPHRMAKIDGDLREIKQTSKMYLEKLADIIPVEEIKPAKYNNYNPNDFDIETWMNSFGIEYKVKQDSDSTKYILNECPFDSSHKAPDSMIFKMPNGAIGFKCLHNSCSSYKWQDLRIKYEPNAYEKNNEAIDKAIEDGWAKHNRDKKKIELNIDNGPIWETIADIRKKPTPDNEYVKTHINIIDKKLHGLLKGGLSVWSGLRASAKSTILSQIALNAVNDEHTVLVYSGELSDKRFTRWFLQQAAGKQYCNEYEKDGSTFWYVPDQTQDKIAEWIGNKVYVFNNSYGSAYERLIAETEKKINDTKPDLVIMDNLMTIDISTLSFNENQAQTTLMLKLSELAKQYNCHIALVAHPRKTVTFLRLVDISGSGNISNLVDSAFIVHRNNHDFEKGFKGEFGEIKFNEMTGTNIIEIAKDREEGIQDEFINLWYEPESRQMKNDKTETIRYGWTDVWNEEDNPFMSEE